MGFKLNGPRGKLGPSAAIKNILGPTAPEEEGGDNIVKKGGKGRTTTLTDKKGRETTFSVNKRKILKGTAIVNEETGVKQPSMDDNLMMKPILGSETQYNLPGSGSEKTTVNLKVKVPHTVSFTNKKGKTKSARSGTKQADRLRAKFNRKKSKVQKGYKGQEKTETGRVLTYKKGSVEYS